VNVTLLSQDAGRTHEQSMSTATVAMQMEELPVADQLSDAFVFFGATGDLAYKKILPALHNMVRHGTLEVPVIAVAKAGWTIDHLRQRARDSIEKYGGGVDEEAFGRLLQRLYYIDGSYEDRATFSALRTLLGESQCPAHYLAIPPSLFATVAKALAQSGCATGARIIVEKPFGVDHASAKALNATLHSVFPESSIFRIDHYLGKEAVENLVHFSRAHLEPQLRGERSDHPGGGLRSHWQGQVLRRGWRHS
jgi:glucose-6-phosphate 1-dehydrogenase